MPVQYTYYYNNTHFHRTSEPVSPTHSPTIRRTKSFAMPSLASRVSFQPQPVYSRLPRDDEAYVMRAFSRHASHCDYCADPYHVHRTGGTLCSKGHRRAIDVAQYIYNKRGQAYSVVDREGSQRVQIEIPRKCDAVRGLLKAMERGLQLRQQAPVASKDRTYYVQERPVNVHQVPAPQRLSKSHVAEPKIPSPPRTASYSTRDSVYEIHSKPRYYESRRPAHYQAPHSPRSSSSSDEDYYYR